MNLQLVPPNGISCLSIVLFKTPAIPHRSRGLRGSLSKPREAEMTSTHESKRSIPTREGRMSLHSLTELGDALCKTEIDQARRLLVLRYPKLDPEALDEVAKQAFGMMNG